jgi:hypothetical protein
MASRLKISDGMFVALTVAGTITVFAILLVVVSEGGVRHAQIFLPEKTENTLAFREIDGKVALVGIKGISSSQSHHDNEDRRLLA